MPSLTVEALGRSSHNRDNFSQQPIRGVRAQHRSTLPMSAGAPAHRLPTRESLLVADVACNDVVRPGWTWDSGIRRRLLLCATPLGGYLDGPVDSRLH